MAANTILLTFDDNGGSKNIYSSTNGTDFVLAGTAGIGVTTYTFIGAQDAIPYWFRVASFNEAGESSYVQSGPITCVWSYRYSFKDERIGDIICN